MRVIPHETDIFAVRQTFFYTLLGIIFLL